jgi:gliding motility-associated-like protein
MLVPGLFCFSKPVSATHCAGGDLTYEWVSDSTYRFIFTLYRYCGGIAANQYVVLNVANSCNQAQGQFTLTRVTTLRSGLPNGSEVSTSCPGYGTLCSGGSYPGYEEWVYSGLVTLPSRCNSWNFYVNVNARNNSTNLVNGSLHNFHVEATLNNLHAQGNSSPYFSIKPVPYICLNVPYAYNQGAVDPDGDSLGFELVTPLYAPGMQMTYIPPYGVFNPFATVAGTFSFSPLTGQIAFTPSMLSQNTVSVRVTEYRNGVRIGSVMRDIQYSVLPCTITQPEVEILKESLEGALYNNGVIEACANTPFRFCFKSVSSSAGAVLVVSDNHMDVFPDAVVSYTGLLTDSVTGCVEINPTIKDVGQKTLVIIVKDSSCNLNGVMVTQSYAIPIVIRPALGTYQRFMVCPGTQVQLMASDTAEVTWSSVYGASVASLSCTTCINPIAAPDVPTRYLAVRSLTNGCANADTVDVIVDNRNSIEITPQGPLVFCDPERIELSATGKGPRPLTNLPCGPASGPATNTADTVIVTPSGKTPYQQPNPVSTPFNGSYATAKHQYLLMATDLAATGMYAGTLSSLALHFQPLSQYAVYKNVLISVKCTDVDRLDPAAGFIDGLTTVFAADSVIIPPQGGWMDLSFVRMYNRDITQNLVVEICYANDAVALPAYTYYTNSPYPATLYAYRDSGAICAVPAATQRIYANHQLPRMRFSYYLAPEIDFRYRWHNGIFQPSANVQHPVTEVANSNKIYVTTQGRNGCVVSDTLDIYVAYSEISSSDSVICLGEQILLRALPKNAHKYQWFENDWNAPVTLSCADCPEPIGTPGKDIIYTLVVEDSFGCVDTLQIPIRVVNPADLHILNNDTVIHYGDSIQLRAEGVSRYSWQPASSLDNPGSSSPIARPLTPTYYSVVGTMGRNCIAFDTVFVDVKYQEVYVPSAFTPNGDGKNDVFRVAHLGHNTLREFRVFNRWGEEVFSTISNKDGWDGTYKGQPQEVGVYYYLIRVVYPDGRERRFKGDVTLIR